MTLASPRPLLCAGFLALFAGALVFGYQDGPQDVEASKVAGNVHVLVGRGGNIGVSVGPDGVLLVDDQFERSVPAIERAIAGLSEADPVFLINTHWHGDHTGANAHFARTATIFAHDNVRRRLEGDESTGGRTAADTPARALPVVTFEDGLSIHFNGEEVRVLHLPAGHTDGDSVVWFTGSNVVHMGDLYFEIGYPFIDLESGGDPVGLIAAVRRVLDTVPADATFIPGHGKPTGADGLRAYLAMLEGAVERVRGALAEGKTAEEMQADGLLSDFDERWGGFDFIPPERFLEILVTSLR